MPMEVDTQINVNVNHHTAPAMGGQQHHQFPSQTQPQQQNTPQSSPNNSNLQNGGGGENQLGGAGIGGGDLASKMNGTAGTPMTEAEKNALMVVLSFLKKHNLKVRGLLVRMLIVS